MFLLKVDIILLQYTTPKPEEHILTRTFLDYNIMDLNVILKV